MQPEIIEDALKRYPDLPLVYDGPLVIVGGGDVDLDLLGVLKSAGYPVIAADGGAQACADAELVPDAIIGDLDSVENVEGWRARTRIFQFDEQETIDFEKCLFATRSPVVIALGMTGGRLDHSLASLDVATRHGADRRIILVNQVDIGITFSGNANLTVEMGARVSIYPLTATSFKHSAGLDYPLDGLNMVQGKRVGTSNTAIAKRIQIEVVDGDCGVWMLVMDRGHLTGLIAQL